MEVTNGFFCAETVVFDVFTTGKHVLRHVPWWWEQGYGVSRWSRWTFEAFQTNTPLLEKGMNPEKQKSASWFQSLILRFQKWVIFRKKNLKVRRLDILGYCILKGKSWEGPSLTFLGSAPWGSLRNMPFSTGVRLGRNLGNPRNLGPLIYGQTSFVEFYLGDTLEN